MEIHMETFPGVCKTNERVMCFAELTAQPSAIRSSHSRWTRLWNPLPQLASSAFNFQRPSRDALVLFLVLLALSFVQMTYLRHY